MVHSIFIVNNTNKLFKNCRVLVCERVCVRHMRACGNLGAKEVWSFMELWVRMCVRAWFFGCVTRVWSHLKFFNKIMKKRLKTKGFLRRSRSLTFTAEDFIKIIEIMLWSSNEYRVTKKEWTLIIQYIAYFWSFYAKVMKKNHIGYVQMRQMNHLKLANVNFFITFAWNDKK